MVKKFVWFIGERENIRLSKEAGHQRPWTTDPILNNWRFCNVNRNDDTETKWIYKNIIDKHSNSNLLWFNLVMARFINWHPTLKAVGYMHQWDRKKFVTTIRHIEGKVWTGAYMVKSHIGVPKEEYVADILEHMWWERMGSPAFSGGHVCCSHWATWFLNFPGVGNFMANQIVTDMKYSHHLVAAPDWESFCLAGPGTQRGLNRVYGRDKDERLHQGLAIDMLTTLRDVVIKRNDYFTEVFRDLNNLSNCLCEFDKYQRVLLGEGTPRARYKPA